MRQKTPSKFTKSKKKLVSSNNFVFLNTYKKEKSTIKTFTFSGQQSTHYILKLNNYSSKIN